MCVCVLLRHASLIFVSQQEFKRQKSPLLFSHKRGFSSSPSCHKSRHLLLSRNGTVWEISTLADAPVTHTHTLALTLAREALKEGHLWTKVLLLLLPSPVTAAAASLAQGILNEPSSSFLLARGKGKNMQQHTLLLLLLLLLPQQQRQGWRRRRRFQTVGLTAPLLLFFHPGLRWGEEEEEEE